MAYDFDYIDNFSGGENSSVAPDLLLENESMVLENFDPFIRGGGQRRHGISLYKTTTELPLRLLDFEYENAGNRVLKKLALLANGSLVDLSDMSSLATGLGKHISWEAYKNKLYILGGGKFLVYNGVAASDVTYTGAETDSNLTAIATCKYITQYGERLFAAGNPGDPNALYYCERGDPTYWKTINIVQAITDDADIIAALDNYHGALVVFKTRAIYAWFGYDPTTDVQFIRLNVHTGTRSPMSIVHVNNMLIYLGDGGVYALAGIYENVINSVKLSTNKNAEFQVIKHTDAVHEDTACAVFHENRYMISVPTVTAGTNNVVYVLGTDGLENGVFCWRTYTGWDINCWLYSLDGNLYSGSSTAKTVHIHTQEYNDLGKGIAVKIKTRPAFQGQKIHLKKYRYGWIWVRQYEGANSDANIVAYADYVTTATADVSPDISAIFDTDLPEHRGFDTGKWDFLDLVTRIFTIRAKGKRINFEITDASVDQPLLIYGIAFEYRIKKPDRG